MIREVKISWNINGKLYSETRFTDQKIDRLIETFQSFYSNDYKLTSIEVIG